MMLQLQKYNTIYCVFLLTLLRVEIKIILQGKEETIKYYGTFEAQAHGKAEGILVKMTCYCAEFKGELTPNSEIQEIVWLDYSNLKVKISPVDQLIFKDLFDKGLIQ